MSESAFDISQQKPEEHLGNFFPLLKRKWPIKIFLNKRLGVTKILYCESGRLWKVSTSWIISSPISQITPEYLLMYILPRCLN